MRRAVVISFLEEAIKLSLKEINTGTLKTYNMISWHS